MSRPLVVRLHDDVRLAPSIVRDGRLLRFHPTALDLAPGRDLVADTPVTTLLAERLLDLDLARPIDGDVPSLGDVTVVVPVRDDHAGIDALLAALVGVRVVVVDDASADPSLLREVAERHRADLVRLDANVGPAAARNQGLRGVRTDLVAFVDADVVVDAPTLQALLVDFADPRVAAVAPRVRTRGGRSWLERYEDSSGALDLGARSATVRPMTAVAYVPSACLVARVDALEGGFDESLRLGEDVDLVWRLLDQDRRVRYRADVVAWHRHRPSTAAWLGQRFGYGLSAGPLATRHGGRVAPAVLWDTAAAALALAAMAPLRSGVLGAAALTGRAWVRAGRADRDVPVDQRTELVVAEARVIAHQATRYSWRHGWPVVGLLALRSRRLRRLLVAAVVLETVIDWRRRRPRLDPIRFGVARRLDDLAYGAGVWAGAARERSLRSLVPSWIGRS